MQGARSRMKSWIEISAARLQANLAALTQTAGPGFGVLCVLKANAYGHGAAQCAPVLVAAGAHWLGVGDLEEGIAVRRALAVAGFADRDTHILVMCGFEPQDTSGLLEYQLTPVLWTPEHVRALEHTAGHYGQRVAAHLEVDTGMGRQGAAPGKALAGVLDALDEAPHVRAEGVFSHLSSAEVVHSIETLKQVSRFGPALEQIAEHQQMPEYLHLGNSSAADEASTLDWLRDVAMNDMSATPLLRPGIALYGYTLPLEGDPFAHPRLAPLLQPIGTWKTRILGLRDIAPGETVGYGATFTAEEPMRLALLPVGYADGFRREASSGLGNGWVMIHGRRAHVVGRVSMNLTVVDVTHHPQQPAAGEEVILLGEGVTAQDHAHWCGTIAYEILCGMRGHPRLV